MIGVFSFYSYSSSLFFSFLFRKIMYGPLIVAGPMIIIMIMIMIMIIIIIIIVIVIVIIIILRFICRDPVTYD